MVSTIPVQKNQVARIMTGAQMPAECDAVIMLELTKEFEKDGKKYISFKRSLKEGENVSFQGEDAKKGDVLVKRNSDQSRDHRLARNIRLCRSASCH